MKSSWLWATLDHEKTIMTRGPSAVLLSAPINGLLPRASLDHPPCNTIRALPVRCIRNEALHHPHSSLRQHRLSRTRAGKLNHCHPRTVSIPRPKGKECSSTVRAPHQTYHNTSSSSQDNMTNIEATKIQLEPRLLHNSHLQARGFSNQCRKVQQLPPCRQHP